MNLLRRISLTYILVSVVVLATGGVFFFIIFRNEVYEEVDEQLRDEKRNIERLLNLHDSIPHFTEEVNSHTIIVPYEGERRKIIRKDTTIIHPQEGALNFRQWQFTSDVNGDRYLVVIRRSLLDLGDLSEQILFAIVIGFVVLLAASFAVNYILLKIILRPFRKTIAELRHFSLTDPHEFRPAASSTTEFQELNNALVRMTDRIRQDFTKTKEFTENASHEIQTPLAIIRNKLELLMQSEHLSHEQAGLIQAAYESANRLSSLNHSLILLTRIENNEFPSGQNIYLGAVLNRLVSESEDRLNARRLAVEFQETSKFCVKINPVLAEVLLSNLLNNAIRYTEPGRTIFIKMSAHALGISNPGNPLPVPPEKIFDRFFRISENSASLGIGLALARTISASSGIGLHYHYSAGFHCFELTI